MQAMCRFCDIVRGKTTEKENKIIVENENYFSVASIGALVEGWVLISPKEHLVSLKDLYNNNEFIDFTNLMVSKMKKQYGKTILAFEHGPNKCDSITSCGTNHAHLHLVPYSQSLYYDMVETKLVWKECHINQIASLAQDNEYLFYCEIASGMEWKNTKGYLHILDKPISQFFRKIIAKQLNCYNEYDYKMYPRINTTIETSNALASKIDLYNKVSL